MHNDLELFPWVTVWHGLSLFQGVCFSLHFVNVCRLNE